MAPLSHAKLCCEQDRLLVKQRESCERRRRKMENKRGRRRNSSSEKTKLLWLKSWAKLQPLRDFD